MGLGHTLFRAEDKTYLAGLHLSDRHGEELRGRKRPDRAVAEEQGHRAVPGRVGTNQQPRLQSLEFEGIRNEAGRNSSHLSAKKWIDATGAIGLHAKAGRYVGTYAHRDIAFEFGSWLSPEFKLYLIKEFQRLKDEEARATSLEWGIQRTLAKINYRIHRDAIKEQLIPPQLSKAQTVTVYASQADVLNVALFGMTAAQWRQANPQQKGNLRDVATLEQLVVLSNLERINAVLIHQGLTGPERLAQLNTIAITQMCSLIDVTSVKRLGKAPER
jgi:hypothetical protein